MLMDHLVNTIFINNRFNNEVRFELNNNMTSKELAHFLHSLFIKGLILLFGYNNQITLNFVTMEQIDKVREKLKMAHVNVRITLFDKQTAVDLEYIPESVPDNIPLEIFIMRHNQMELGQKPDNLNLKDYIFKKYLNDKLICITFEVI